MKNKYIINTTLIILFSSITVQAKIKPEYKEAMQDIIDTAKKFVEESIKDTKNTKSKIEILPFNILKNIHKCKKNLIVKNKEEIKIAKFNKLEIVCMDENNNEAWSQEVKTQYTVLYPKVYAKKDILIGKKLTRNDLEIKYVTYNKISKNNYKDINQVLNAKAIRKIKANKAIRHQNVCLICKGDPIKIKIESVNFSLIANGIAMQNGNKGEKINIINQENDKKLNGIILSEKIVEIRR